MKTLPVVIIIKHDEEVLFQSVCNEVNLGKMINNIARNINWINIFIGKIIHFLFFISP